MYIANHNAYRSASCKVIVIFVRFEWNSNILRRFWKNVQMSNYMKIRPVGGGRVVTCGRTDTQTEMPKLIIALRNFTKAPKNTTHISHPVHILDWRRQMETILNCHAMHVFLDLLIHIWPVHDVLSLQCSLMAEGCPICHGPQILWRTKVETLKFWECVWGSCMCTEVLTMCIA